MRAPEFWSNNSGGARWLSRVLAPVGFVYGRTVKWKAANANSYRPKAKVICVGNLTAGGSGKTPVCLAIAKRLSAHHLRVVILSRGYGGKARGPVFVHPQTDLATDVGDEALMEAASARVIVAKDRRAGAELADIEETDVIIMDDGHQNFALTKDLSLVVVDAEAGFGNGRALPAGPLREPVTQGLSRADAVVLVGNGSPDLGKYRRPVVRAHLEPRGGALRGRRVVAFAGIGRPEKFFASLHEIGAEVISETAFPDHHVYSASEIARLKAKARGVQADPVTTEKDYVRLTPAERAGVDYLRVEAVFDDETAIMGMLDKLWPGGIPRRPA